MKAGRARDGSVPIPTLRESQQKQEMQMANFNPPPRTLKEVQRLLEKDLEQTKQQ